jgi:hypothetical protein
MKLTEKQVRQFADGGTFLSADLAADWLEMYAEIARLRERNGNGEWIDPRGLTQRGGKWLGAARSWLQHRRTVAGTHGDQITWGDVNAIFQLSARDIEKLAAEVAAAAINENGGDNEPVIAGLRKSYLDEQIKHSQTVAERDSLRKRLADAEATIASMNHIADVNARYRAKEGN